MDFEILNIGIKSFLGFLVFLITSGLIAYAFRGYILKNFEGDFANKKDLLALEKKMDDFARTEEVQYLTTRMEKVEIQVKENRERQVVILEKIEEQLSILSLSSATVSGLLSHIEKRLDTIENRQWNGIERRRKNNDAE